MTIHQEIRLPADPQTVFKTLASSDKFAAMSGQPATIDANAGGAFSCFGDKISGRFIELTPDARIVKAWRPGNWEAGRYSLVRIDLTPDGSGTKLTLTQDGHPSDHEPHLEAGWEQMYWQPLKAYLTA
ncbi:MAG: SRPBCC domain-containing protein [Litorimonas sp.]